MQVAAAVGQPADFVAVRAGGGDAFRAVTRQPPGIAGSGSARLCTKSSETNLNSAGAESQ